LRPRTRDDGSILVLVIGYTAIAAVLLVVGVDTSKVFLARRALASAADAAALAAAQGIDRNVLYNGPGPQCREPLPLSPRRAADLAAGSVALDRGHLGHLFASLSAPATSVAGGSAGVELTGEVAVPFGRVLSWLDPADSGGLVRVSETSHARSPAAGGVC
jgi:Putative Flp pilus-assembly TadE/G-like